MTSTRQPVLSTFASALLFAGLGVASRYHFRATETRWQITAFIGAVGVAEIGWAAFGVRPSWLRFAIGASAATAAITATKFHVEPQALHTDAAQAAHIVRNGARKILR